MIHLINKRIYRIILSIILLLSILYYFIIFMSPLTWNIYFNNLLNSNKLYIDKNISIPLPKGWAYHIFGKNFNGKKYSSGWLYIDKGFIVDNHLNLDTIQFSITSHQDSIEVYFKNKYIKNSFSKNNEYKKYYLDKCDIEVYQHVSLPIIVIPKKKMVLNFQKVLDSSSKQFIKKICSK